MLQPRTAPVYSDVATLIAPTDMPVWLPTLLSDWAPALAIARGVHAVQPTKAQMCKKLSELSDSAVKLLRALQDKAWHPA